MQLRSLLSLVAAFLVAVPLACAGSEVASGLAPTGSAQPTEPHNSPPDGGPGVNPSNPDEALPPVLSSVTPNKATVGSVGPSIVVAGENFVPRTIVQLDGAPLATTFVSDIELRAMLPTSKLAAVGTLRLSVGTSPPGGGASKEIAFNVENPAPAVTALAPLSTPVGSSETALVVSGSSFVQGAKVVFGQSDLPTTFVSDTSLQATIPGALLQASGSIPVAVVNPAPGGGKSGSIAFTVTNPSAVIQSINPSGAFVGSAPLSMKVVGGGFVPGSAVVLNGQPLGTSYVSAGELDADVPAALLAAAGDFPVSVNNPPPGGGLSAPVVFRVQYPAPSPSSLSPASALVGSGPTTITVTGLGFFLTSQITFDNAPAATTYVDATHLEATLDTPQLATAGTIAVRVVNPAPSGGVSSALSFDVLNIAPTIGSIDPSSVTAGSPDRTITLYGSGFVPSSTVKVNGVVVPGTYVTSSQLTATVPSSQLLYPGNVAVTVTNPAPGGGTSAPRTLSVGCETTGADVMLTSVGQTVTKSTSFASAPLMSCFSDSGSCSTTTIDPATPRPARYWVVQNTSSAPITLSAWADCTKATGEDDAYLTFYRRPTVPANDAERLACAFAVAEGINGSGGYSSPDSGTSMWCPGLTKANGGGLTLGVCEKAVVHIQAWSNTSTTYTMPKAVKIKAE